MILLYVYIFICCANLICGDIGRIALMEKLVEMYKFQHGIEALRKEPHVDLCRRKFSKSFQFEVSCVLAGNSLGSFFNSIALSIVLNRTYVLETEDALAGATKCHGALLVDLWIPRLNDVDKLLNDAGCSVDFDKRVSGDDPIAKIPKEIGFANSSAPVLCCDGLFHLARSMCQKAPLDASARYRANILFSPSVIIGDHEGFEAFGLIQLHTLHFTHLVSALTEPILRYIFKDDKSHSFLDYKDDLQVIGVHLRHTDKKSIKDSSIDLPYDNAAGNALRKVRTFSNASRCVILVASDRAASIARVRAVAGELGCSCLYIKRNMTAEPAAFRDGISYVENGPWAHSLIQIADWRLITYSQIFIGSRGSTFSWLIAEGVAARATFLRREDETRNLVWLDETLSVVYDEFRESPATFN